MQYIIDQNLKLRRLNGLSPNVLVFCLEYMGLKWGGGTIIREITIFLALNKWYEILLSSGCQRLWMYEPGSCVFHIKLFFFLFFCLVVGWGGGGGGEDAIHITWLITPSKHRWTLTCCRRWWGNRVLRFAFYTLDQWGSNFLPQFFSYCCFFHRFKQ